jgi:hypothetical protein
MLISMTNILTRYMCECDNKKFLLIGSWKLWAHAVPHAANAESTRLPQYDAPHESRKCIAAWSWPQYES